MSKYIVDTDDFEPLFKVDSIGVFGIGKSLSDSDEDHSWSRIKSVGEFEELNSDYINEHYGNLQDEAYQRGLHEGNDIGYNDGFEDGKLKSEDGCTGCKYEGKTGEYLPCDYCMNNCKNQWTAKQTDDKSIDIIRNGIHNWVTELNVKLDDIASILEAMKHD